MPRTVLERCRGSHPHYWGRSPFFLTHHPWLARYASVLFLLAALCLTMPAQAQEQHYAGFNVLRLTPSARAAALGGNLPANYGEDINTVFYNPALLNERMHRGLSVSYLNHLADINAGSAAYGWHFGSIATVAAGIRFLHWGALEGADAAGMRTGSFSASDLVFTLGAARAQSAQFRYGATVHVVHSTIEQASASALAADVGLHYHLAGQQVGIAASAHNIGVTLSSLGPTGDVLPFDLRVGITKQLRYVPLLVMLTGRHLHTVLDARRGGNLAGKIFSHILVGGEFRVSRNLAIRIGYDHRQHTSLQKTDSRLDLAGFGIGFEIRIRRFRLDYAYQSWSFSGLHYLTIRSTL